MDIDLLYKSYIVQEEVLKTELVNNIKKYLTKVITKITLSKSISIRIHIRDINMIEKAYNDIFGGVCVHDNQKRNAKISGYYLYEFDVHPEYNKERNKLKWKSHFKMHRISKEVEDAVPFNIETLNSYINRSIQRGSNLKAESKSCSNPDEQAQPTLLHGNKYNDIDTFLLDPQIHRSNYKRSVVFGALLYAMPDKSRTTNYPMQLAYNIMGSAQSMDKKDRDMIFLLLSLGLEDRYHSHIGIDKSAYKDPKIFMETIEEVLHFAKSTNFALDIEYADIIKDLMINCRRNCLKDSYYSELESFAKKLSGMPKAEDLFVKILTRDGTTAQYIIEIAKSMKKTEKAIQVFDYMRHSNQFLLWIILGIVQFKHGKWHTLVKECYALFKIIKSGNDFKDYSLRWGCKVSLAKLFDEIEHIVCVKDNK
ncbi:hypothetical protein NERG_02109 [Nematocida ausubeli]|uniref:Uncharacterized protein n=1 Tax=Nematocida ausubeli (strain ATCC PRA-371 / ERTm2) TaxID=1913371 RepID=H8ZET8_NEMA1|nr:hypothetical protein NERG_02109 [Nematocida ausubeli]